MLFLFFLELRPNFQVKSQSYLISKRNKKIEKNFIFKFTNVVPIQMLVLNQVTLFSMTQYNKKIFCLMDF